MSEHEKQSLQLPILSKKFCEKILMAVDKLDHLLFKPSNNIAIASTSNSERIFLNTPKWV